MKKVQTPSHSVAGKNSDQHRLIAAMQSLEKHMQILASCYEPHRYMMMAFIRGIFYGLGIVVAIALVIPILLAMLSTVDWIPYLGDAINEIIIRVESAQQPYSIN